MFVWWISEGWKLPLWPGFWMLALNICECGRDKRITNAILWEVLMSFCSFPSAQGQLTDFSSIPPWIEYHLSHETSLMVTIGTTSMYHPSFLAIPQLTLIQLLQEQIWCLVVRLIGNSIFALGAKIQSAKLK